MNGNYQVSRFLANERVNGHLKAAQAHRRAKSAGRSNKVSLDQSIVKMSNRIGQTAQWLIGQASRTLHQADEVKPALR